MGKRKPFDICGVRVEPGTRMRVDLVCSRHVTATEAPVPIHVIHGAKSGPVLAVTAALHGDEVLGVEVVRRVLGMSAMNQCAGTLLALPVVNVHGVQLRSRYLPDRRDLNRSFPGSPTGSQAARLAHKIMEEVVGRADVLIDLHTGSNDNENLPQVRADLQNPETERLARAFAVPVLLDSVGPEGTLRQAATRRGVPTLLYESGEALRFDEVAIRAGVRGIAQVMSELGMLARPIRGRSAVQPVVSNRTRWMRAPQSGLWRVRVRLGEAVRRHQVVGVLSDPHSRDRTLVRSSDAGLVIGISRLPLALEGDALVHVACLEQPSRAAGPVDAFELELDPDAGRGPSGALPAL